MEKLRFSSEEVLAYMEDLISLNMASEEEMEFYEECLWSGKMKKLNNTYRKIVVSMREEYNRKF